MDLNKYLVQADGLIDADATLKGVSEAIAAHNTAKANDVEKVNSAINAVFADFPGANITAPALVSLALAKLNVTDPAHFGSMSARIRATMQERVAAGTLVTKRGKGGGFSVPVAQ